MGLLDIKLDIDLGIGLDISLFRTVDNMGKVSARSFVATDPALFLPMTAIPAVPAISTKIVNDRQHAEAVKIITMCTSLAEEWPISSIRAASEIVNACLSKVVVGAEWKPANEGIKALLALEHSTGGKPTLQQTINEEFNALAKKPIETLNSDESKVRERIVSMTEATIEETIRREFNAVDTEVKALSALMGNDDVPEAATA